MIKRNLMIVFILLFSIIVIAPIYAHDSNDTCILENSSSKTYTDLYNQINDTSEVLVLNESYKYDSNLDGELNDGVVLSKNISVVGRNNASIDGSGMVRGITIESYCNVIIENLTFINGFSNNSGGGIFLKDNSSLILRNCIFKNNWVYNSNGGAIYAHMGTDLEIHNCTFTNNTAVRESDLDWEEFKKGMGSVICQSIGSNLKICDSIIRNNIAYLSTILLVSFTQDKYNLSTLSIKNCLFENNTSFSSGVVYLDEYGKGEILDSIFKSNNITDHSGVLVLDSSIYALIQNCLFEGNHATNGGAMHIKLFEETPANVTIINCNFTRNVANQQGGVIYSNRGIVKIINSIFADNNCSGNGGAIIATKGSIDIENSSFINNSAYNGGALYLTCDYISIANTSFVNNTAIVYGPAIYSKSMNITSFNCSYVNNSAGRGGDVYGVFNVTISFVSSYFNNVTFKINVTSIWNASLEQEFKIKFIGVKNYTVSSIKINSDGMADFTVPVNLNADIYTMAISSYYGAYVMAPQTANIIKLPYKLTANKLTTTYLSGKIFKVYLKGTNANAYLKGIKIQLKVYTGSKYKTYTLTTDKNGMVKFDTSKLSVGTHKIIASTSSNIKYSIAITSVKVKKATSKMVCPKSAYTSSKINIKIKNKASGKVIKNTKFKVKVYTGKKFKTYNLKTNSKGIIKVPTKNLKTGNHKITVTLKNSKYNIYNKFTVKIKNKKGKNI